MKQLEKSTTAHFRIAATLPAQVCDPAHLILLQSVFELARKEAPHTDISFQVTNCETLIRKYVTNRLVLFEQQEQSIMPVWQGRSKKLEI